jgi:hypothetical protein
MELLFENDATPPPSIGHCRSTSTCRSTCQIITIFTNTYSVSPEDSETVLPSVVLLALVATVVGVSSTLLKEACNIRNAILYRRFGFAYLFFGMGV